MNQKIKFYNRILTLVVFAVCLSAFSMVTSVVAADFVVIVNSKNTYSASETEMKNVVKRIFLKQQSSWPGGSTTKVFDGKKGGLVQAAFSASMLKMDDVALASYWLGLKQKTGETPPRNVGSKNSMIKLVSKYDGAIGIIDKASAEDASGQVKILMDIK